MVSLDLGGPWAKLNHAKLHVDTLRQAIKTATPNEDLISLGRKYDDKEQEVTYFIDDIAVIDPEWSLLVGDAVHDMRSALDHLMWQLARRHLGRAPTEKEAKSIQFPEVRRLKEFTNSRFLRYVEPDDIARLKLFQPYKRLRKGQLHPLPKLVKLSNIDKHRRLHLIVVRPFSASFTNRLDAYRDCVPDLRLIPGNAQPVDWFIPHRAAGLERMT